MVTTARQVLAPSNAPVFITEMSLVDQTSLTVSHVWLDIGVVKLVTYLGLFLIGEMHF